MRQDEFHLHSRLRSTKEGSDCANKVQTVITRLPGVREPKVNVPPQTLRLTLDEAQKPRTQLERTLRLPWGPLGIAGGRGGHTDGPSLACPSGTALVPDGRGTPRPAHQATLLVIATALRLLRFKPGA